MFLIRLCGLQKIYLEPYLDSVQLEYRLFSTLTMLIHGLIMLPISTLLKIRQVTATPLGGPGV